MFLIIGIELIIAGLFYLLFAITQTGDTGKWVAGYLLSVPLVGSLIIAGLFLLGDLTMSIVVSVAVALVIVYIIAMFVTLLIIGIILTDRR